MIWFYVAITAILAGILLLQLYWVWIVRRTQKQFLSEVKEQNRPTMWDVREVLREGDKDLAVQLYCEVFGIDDIERARKEVEELERSIRP